MLPSLSSSVAAAVTALLCRPLLLLAKPCLLVTLLFLVIQAHGTGPRALLFVDGRSSSARASWNLKTRAWKCVAMIGSFDSLLLRSKHREVQIFLNSS